MPIAGVQLAYFRVSSPRCAGVSLSPWTGARAVGSLYASLFSGAHYSGRGGRWTSRLLSWSTPSTNGTTVRSSARLFARTWNAATKGSARDPTAQSLPPAWLNGSDGRCCPCAGTAIEPSAEFGDQYIKLLASLKQAAQRSCCPRGVPACRLPRRCSRAERRERCRGSAGGVAGGSAVRQGQGCALQSVTTAPPARRDHAACNGRA
jgi:hypothetical protein